MTASYSQHGEDLIIDVLLGHKPHGFYLDVGAFDPEFLSNTALFHKRGWSGCNIEPDPEHFQRFLRQRPSDVNLNVGVGKAFGTMLFTKIEPATESTFIPERVNSNPVKGQSVLPVLRIVDIWRGALRKRHCDFCSIDAEGMDLDVLQGNDWSQFRPTAICIEVTSDLNEITSVLTSNGYLLAAETSHEGKPLNRIFTCN